MNLSNRPLVVHITSEDELPDVFYGVPMTHGEWCAVYVAGKAGEFYKSQGVVADTIAYYRDEGDAVSMVAQINMARRSVSAKEAPSFLAAIRD